ncbi:MAG: cobalamin-dependent protein [Pseudomonadota bacterium]
MALSRSELFPETRLPETAALIEQGRTHAKTWKVEPGAFLKETGVACESDFKRQMAVQGRIMQHAQMGFRDQEKSRRTWAEVYETSAKHGVTVDRYGITLDWSMGQTRAKRKEAQKGTGLILDDVEDFVALTRQAPVAPHFGDFVLGFPAALESTQAALAAGSTSIGNLGQYFTFRLPGDDDDLSATEATVVALALIAAQDVEVLVHSNLDDGYAAVFTDLASCLGAVLLERHIVEDLLGASISHCYGHHFTDPARRLAFHLALAQVTDTPGTMIYGNTVAYKGTPAQNFASLASYLTADILGQKHRATGHAINPVPVTENQRIPDIDEIIDAQLFASRMVEHAEEYEGLINLDEAKDLANQIVQGAHQFKDNVLAGLAEAGVDTQDAVELLLTLRRLEGKRLEELFGAGQKDQTALRGRAPVVQSSLVEELQDMAEHHLAEVAPAERELLKDTQHTVLAATTDVHEHGKLLLEYALNELGVTVLDGGVSTDADKLAAKAAESGADCIAVSTFNGVALTYVQQLKAELARLELSTPILIGGRLNQIPDGSNTSLPVDVSDELIDEGVTVCRALEDVVPALLSLGTKSERQAS